MNFRVNGTPYFLTYDSERGEWCVLTPGSNGIETLEVHGDGTAITAPRRVQMTPAPVN
jgi:hypothetical protein